MATVDVVIINFTLYSRLAKEVNMNNFMDQDFLLDTKTAKHLYHDYAKKMPIVDYHCHINPQEIYEDKKFDNITQVWLGGDHYKWRQIRSNGVPEKLITGNESTDREKFDAWAATMPKLIGNPLYSWSHLELQKYFGYTGHLSPETADEVWNLTKEKLSSDELSVRNIIRNSNVKVICTTDDPIDSLEGHIKLREVADLGFSVLPAWRPDKATNIEKTDYNEYIQKLSSVSGISVKDFESLKTALKNRLDFFNENGCSVSDHGVDFVYYYPSNDAAIDAIMKKKLAGDEISLIEQYQYKTALLLFLGREYHRLNWVMQLHFGCKRNNNTAMFNKLGPDTGFDSISGYAPADQLANFLDALSITDELPKVILYSLNPNDDAAIGTIIGCFQDSSTIGKVQQGSAWWFNDHYEGMRAQMKSLAALGCFGNFNGMLTDSRSFLSYTRHDYFRRILCVLVGEWVESGQYPNDDKALKELVENISFNNAVRYFGFEIK